MTTTSHPDTVVLTETVGSTLVITVNRPKARNAVNGEVAQAISAAIDELESDPALRVGVLTGTGGVFSAGMDLKAAGRGESASVPGRGFGGLTEARVSKPLIAAVEGFAFGGGFELALSCDLIVAASTASFALPEVKRGLIAGGGGVVRLPKRIPHHLAMELLLTGRSIGAGRAQEHGIVNHVTAEGEALATALGLAEEITENAPLALAAVKRIVALADGVPETEAFAVQREQAAGLATSEDFAEGVKAFTERRSPQWTGR